ncbi:MAG: hypothetical protein SPL99_06045 [Catonella sp.]|jgi:hypothetical protein|nr:hypothetical protein [Catonella sp.]MDY6356084.1 hypothetical protein [Catonella sp.]
MHVTTKKLTTAGITLALSMVINLLVNIFNLSSLFILMVSGFLIGVVIRMCGMKMAVSYLVASSALALIIAPEKLDVLAYIFTEIYIVAREFIYKALAKKENIEVKKRKRLYFFFRWLMFQAMIVPIIIFLPGLLLTVNTPKMKITAYLLGQVYWYLADYCYNAFQRFFEARVMKKIM